MKPTLSMYESAESLKKAGEAYEAGRKAFHDGVEFEDRPMPSTDEWDFGWFDAYAESK